MFNFSSEIRRFHIVAVLQFFKSLERNVFESIRNNFKTFVCHIFTNDIVKDIIFLGVSEVGLLVMVIEGFIGKPENILWGTFNINSNVVWVSCDCSNNSFNLQVLVEW